MRRRRSAYAARPAFLSNTMNSMPGRWPSSLCSSLPMIHVISAPGHASCSVRTTGSAWHTSPSADSRSTQMRRGGVLEKSGDMGGSGRQRQSDGEQSVRASPPGVSSSVSAGPEIVAPTARGAMLYDASRCDQPDERIFARGHWRAAGSLQETAGGRGTVAFIRDGERRWVLRHYRRGGLVARLLGDRYLWTGANRTRAFREWRLLRELRAAGLPVPAPVAARYERDGLFYRADLVTTELPTRRTLAHALADGPLDAETLARRGRVRGSAARARRAPRRPQRAQPAARGATARSTCSISIAAAGGRVAPGSRRCSSGCSARCARSPPACRPVASTMPRGSTCCAA